VALRRAPITGVVMLTAAATRAGWRLEGHLGAGLEWLWLRAVALAGEGPPLKTGHRSGAVAQAGLGLFRTLEGLAGGAFSLGAELRLVAPLPRQVIVLGDQRLGASSLPSAAATLGARWTVP
jgi:hypothetical protein